MRRHLVWILAAVLAAREAAAIVVLPIEVMPLEAEDFESGEYFEERSFELTSDAIQQLGQLGELYLVGHGLGYRDGHMVDGRLVKDGKGASSSTVDHGSACRTTACSWRCPSATTAGSGAGSGPCTCRSRSRTWAPARRGPERTRSASGSTERTGRPPDTASSSSTCGATGRGVFSCRPDPPGGHIRVNPEASPPMLEEDCRMSRSLAPESRPAPPRPPPGRARPGGLRPGGPVPARVGDRPPPPWPDPGAPRPPGRGDRGALPVARARRDAVRPFPARQGVRAEGRRPPRDRALRRSAGRDRDRVGETEGRSSPCPAEGEGSGFPMTRGDRARSVVPGPREARYFPTPVPTAAPAAAPSPTATMGVTKGLAATVTPKATAPPRPYFWIVFNMVVFLATVLRVVTSFALSDRAGGRACRESGSGSGANDGHSGPAPVEGSRGPAAERRGDPVM